MINWPRLVVRVTLIEIKKPNIQVTCFTGMRIILLIVISVFLINCQNDKRLQAQEPPSHYIFDQLLNEYVSEIGVNYRDLQGDSSRLNDYLNILSDNAPAESWKKEEKLAYWINAYNAFTLKLIIDNYPLESITDLHPTIHIPLVNTVWHKKFFKIGGKPTSLDEIEHKILRKEFDEPRIHFAINCASISCPPLRDEAFVANILEKQLEEQAEAFINDSTRNHITPDNPKVSKIFSWFSGDFKNGQTLIDYLNRYAHVKISKGADVDYLKYDWALNDVR